MSSSSLTTAFALKPIFSDMSIAASVLLRFPLAENTFSHSFALSLSVSLGLQWVFCKHHTYGSFYNPLSKSIVLVGASNPFTFKISINMYDLITIFLILLGLYL